jgi:hypothetical protein
MKTIFEPKRRQQEAGDTELVLAVNIKGRSKE